MINRILIRTRVLQIAYAHLHRDELKLRTAEEDLATSLEQTYALYLYLLCLPVELTRYHRDLIDRRSRKHFASDAEKRPNLRLAHNRLVAQLETCQPLQSWYQGFDCQWEHHIELLRHLIDLIEASDFYKAYLNSEDTYESDRTFWIQVFQRILVSDQYLATTLEESSIYWDDELQQTEKIECEDEPSWDNIDETIQEAINAKQHSVQRFTLGTVEIVKDFVTKSLRYAHESEPFDSALLAQYKDPDDEKYAKHLLHQLLVDRGRYDDLVDTHIKDTWERDRLADIDLLIIQLAIVEFLHLPMIPTQVTINEYVELSKHYSTPRSSSFINGVLDAIATTLRKEGRILKK